MGGPMMGRAVYSDAFPIVKNNNAILIFDGPQALIPEESSCIKCGMCIKACPFGLMPVSMVEAYEDKDVERLQRLKSCSVWNAEAVRTSALQGDL